jgi:YbdK family carboxylate-amine ligase
MATARRAAAELLFEAGARYIGGGLHPDVKYGDVKHVETERYQAIREEMRGLLSRTPTAALHVHVGMPDPDTAIHVCNRLRVHLPLFQALAAHSPYWFGVDSGLASSRSAVFRAFPRSRVPQAFDSWDHYQEVIRWCVATAEVPDYTFVWWDIRPSPNLGTVEVRAMDAQSRIESVAGIAALVHALAVACADGAEEIAPPTEGIASPLPCGARRDRRHDLVAARCGRCARRIAARVALATRNSTARTRSRRSSASCARAAARTACALHAEGGMAASCGGSSRSLRSPSERRRARRRPRRRPQPRRPSREHDRDRPGTERSLVAANEIALFIACSAMHGSSEPVRW